MKRALLIIVFLFIVLTMPVSAHSGRTDSSGGHNCNVGSCAGTYHYHNGGPTTPAPAQTYTPPPAPAPTPTPTPTPTPKPVKNTESPTKKKAASNESKSNDGSDSSCFIATAAYGTPVAQDIDTLRDFRDTALTNNIIGKTFIDGYYKYSPPIADVIGSNDVLRWYVREGYIKPLVGIIELTSSWWG